MLLIQGRYHYTGGDKSHTDSHDDGNAGISHNKPSHNDPNENECQYECQCTGMIAATMVGPTTIEMVRNRLKTSEQTVQQSSYQFFIS